MGDLINEKYYSDLKSELYTNEDSFANKFNNSSFLKFMSNLEEGEPKRKSLSKQKKETQIQNNEKENTVVMKKFLIQNFNTSNDKPNSAKDHKIKINDNSFKQKGLNKDKNNISLKNSPVFSTKLKFEMKNAFIPNTQKILRNVSSNRKSADSNFFERNNLLKKQSSPKNPLHKNTYEYCKTESNDSDFKLEIKPSHTRIFSTIENSLQKANIINYSKTKSFKNDSISKKMINVNNSKNSNTPTNQEDKNILSFNNRKPNQQHKYTKSDVNGGKMMSLGSPKSNKELKYFYKTKNLTNFKNIALKNLNIGEIKKNVSEIKNDDMLLKSLISPKLNKISEEKSSKLIFNY